MSAKSVFHAGSLEPPSKPSGKLRTALSTFVLVASVTALGLILHTQHPAWFKVSPGEGRQLTANERALDDVSRESAARREVERDRALSEFLAKRYRVSSDVTLDFVRLAFATGQRMGVDPLLIIAVMAVESSFNPIAESVAGAKGLMQIIPRYHAEKFVAFGGEHAVFDPRANIVIGAQILSEYIQRAGDVNLGLRIYGGGPVEGENFYPGKVLGEKRRLQQVVSQHYRTTAQSPSRERMAL